MSIDTCYKCGAFVDTDIDGDCYIEASYKGHEITRCLCETCREKPEGDEDNEKESNG